MASQVLTHLKEKLQFVQKENEVLREELEGLDSLVRTFLMEYLGILRIDIYNPIYIYIRITYACTNYI